MPEGTETTETKTETKVEVPEKTLTQAEVDAIVQDRLARERKKYEGHDELRQKAAELDELKAAQQSEAEKERARAEKAEAEAEKLRNDLRSSTLRSSLTAEASKADRKVVDPSAAVEFLTGADKDLLTLDEDGSPTNVAEAMDKLLERRTYLVGTATREPTPSADQGARGGGPNQVTESELAKMSPEEIVKAREEGRLTHLLGG